MEPFTHVRADGFTLTLRGPRWCLEIRKGNGKLAEQPQDWLVEHFSGARTVALRKCAEPIVFGAELAADALAVLAGMARIKRGEREAIEQALREGRAVTLKNLLRGLDGRRLKSARGMIGVATANTRALCDRVKHAEQVAVAALEPALVARLDAYIAAARAS